MSNYGHDQSLPSPSMTPVLPSAKFIHIYDSLSPEAQRRLVKSQLGSALDAAPRKRAKRIVGSAARFKSHQEATPVLNYRAKKREINGLLADLARDAKFSFVKERSCRAELMDEVMDSIGTWICDLWIAVYEHAGHFDEAHQSLLFIGDVLKRLNDASKVGGCPCATQHILIDIAIRRLSGSEVKRFQLHGCHSLTSVLLWMWRELFLSMSVAGGKRARAQIPLMLQDIEDDLGWQSIIRILYGGSRDSEETDEEDWEDVDHDNEKESEIEVDSRCTCNLHANHWSKQVNRHRLYLRRLVKAHLRRLFTIAPSEALYTTLVSFGCRDLLDTLSEVAGASSDNLAAALDIYSSEEDPDSIMKLVDEHSHLLRPRDSYTLQMALLVACENQKQHRSRLLAITEHEMVEIIHSVAAVVRSNFCNIDDPKHVSDLRRIVRLPAASNQRAERIEQWVDSVVTPTATPLHAVAFAAMMMGIPAPGIEEGEDPDFLGHLDLEPNDPDLEDLREELRPPLGDRFDGWTEVAASIRGSPSTMAKVYAKLLEVMPFLRAHDVTEAMQTRVSDRPSKRYVSDALAALSSFCKIQRRKAALRADNKRGAEADKKRKAEAAAAAEAAVAAAASPPVDDDDDDPPPLEAIPGSTPIAFSLGGNFSFSFGNPTHSPPAPVIPAGHSSFGGIDDVD